MLGHRRAGRGGESEARDRPLHLFRERHRATPQPTQSYEACEHLQAAPARDVGEPTECEDHGPDDGAVVNLRVCLDCGHVGCCDSSTARHATGHAHAAGHPVIQSGEPGETWRWCYPDELLG
jgi:hypothetical protein